MTPIQLTHKISQHGCLLRDKLASYESEKTSVNSAIKKLSAKARKGTVTQGEVDYLQKRTAAIEKLADGVIAGQEAHLDLLNQGIKGGFERMHGLLAYCAATGGLSTEAQLLYGSLDDYLTAKSAPDRDAAARAVSLCLDHGNPFGVPGDGTKAPDTAILDEYESIENPEQSTRFYKEHRDVIHAQLQARQDAANQP